MCRLAIEYIFRKLILDESLLVLGAAHVYEVFASMGVRDLGF